MRNAALLLVALTAIATPVAAQGFRVEIVEDKSGLPIPFATVTLLSDKLEVVESAVVSDSMGRLFVPVPGPAKYRLTILRLGYTAVTTDSKKVEGKDIIPMRIALKQSDQLLLPVNVLAEKGTEIREMELRKVYGRGRILTKGRIDSMGYRNVADAINAQGHMALEEERDGWRYSPAFQSACSNVNIFLNNQMLYSGPFTGPAFFSASSAFQAILDTDLRKVHAIEYYPTRVSIPPEFAFSGKACAAFVVWTRPYR